MKKGPARENLNWTPIGQNEVSLLVRNSTHISLVMPEYTT
ncbi:hypothetical protein GBAR_LOCUS22823 [Geodia barretti]|uniref:Uncharacterized protein n=1 Tax=Geodia barretti TaxID=519541 RepID=A0AA35T4J0_GEOBA|nr:hypothetical protein GBAR_LOCUS22823 [Geodia barretti]